MIILWLMTLGGLILEYGNLDRLRVLMCGCGMACVMLVLLRNGGAAVTAHRLHGNRNGQCVAAEQRKPNG